MELDLKQVLNICITAGASLVGIALAFGAEREKRAALQHRVENLESRQVANEADRMTMVRIDERTQAMAASIKHIEDQLRKHRSSTDEGWVG